MPIILKSITDKAAFKLCVKFISSVMINSKSSFISRSIPGSLYIPRCILSTQL